MDGWQSAIRPPGLKGQSKNGASRANGFDLTGILAVGWRGWSRLAHSIEIYRANSDKVAC